MTKTDRGAVDEGKWKERGNPLGEGAGGGEAELPSRRDEGALEGEEG